MHAHDLKLAEKIFLAPGWTIYDTDGQDTIFDFVSGEDLIDLTAFELESFADVGLTQRTGGVGIDLPEADDIALLSGLTTLPTEGDFLIA